MLLGIVGKTNVGKSTFFSAATMSEVEIGDRPFVTIKPNEGVGYVRVRSVCTELNVRCDPKYGWCNGINRFVPVKLMDVAGLVPGAHQGRGLGNQFLDDLRKSDANIIVVDAAGSTDDEGKPVPPGTHDPVRDVQIVKEEFTLWMAGVLRKNLEKVSRRMLSGEKPEKLLSDVLSGLEVKPEDVKKAMDESGLDPKKILQGKSEDILRFSECLRRNSKPFLVAANKIDVPQAGENFERIKKELEEVVVPVSSQAELILKKAARNKLIRYEPGDSSFSIIDESKLTDAQRKALKLIEERVLDVYGSTGVQKTLESAVFDVLGSVVVFPVENENKFCDKDGNVLPDAFIMPRGSKVIDLAMRIHSEIAEKAAFAVNARTKERISLETELKHRDVIKIYLRRY
ncbi:MAG: redox-regulated ATPase YchF [Candidatus Methanodesulfokora sp.]|jgi:ribosome-binding ATPase YchF (GTP1/OBG family)